MNIHTYRWVALEAPVDESLITVCLSFGKCSAQSEELAPKLACIYQASHSKKSVPWQAVELIHALILLLVLYAIFFLLMLKMNPILSG